MKPSEELNRLIALRSSSSELVQYLEEMHENIAKLNKTAEDTLSVMTKWESIFKLIQIKENGVKNNIDNTLIRFPVSVEK